MPNIHPTAVVDTKAKVGKGALIEPYVVIGPHVIIGERTVVKSHSYITGHVTIGPDCVIWPGASIGSQTQALKYQGEVTYVKIGARCQIREYVTINSSYDEGDIVSVGCDCLIMAYCHIAHHCTVGSGVIMSNSVQLAGHVQIGDHATIGGMSAFHQHTRVGNFAMVGGMSRVTHDIPPYTLGGGVPYKMGGINVVGLQRRGFSIEQRHALSKIFRVVYRNDAPLAERLVQLEAAELDYQAQGLSSEAALCREWIDFCAGAQRGLIDISSSRSSSSKTDVSVSGALKEDSAQSDLS